MDRRCALILWIVPNVTGKYCLCKSCHHLLIYIIFKLSSFIIFSQIRSSPLYRRLGKLPAKDYPKGSMRPVYGEYSQYPRYIREDRGPTWSKENLEMKPKGLKEMWMEGKTPILGYIPQVAHTYAVIEGEYGFMNEHQVSMGESTCAVR